jgi:hypothetical protein
VAVLGVVALSGREPGRWSQPVAMAVFGLSVVTFLAFRWHRLRQELAAGILTPESFSGSVRAKLLGPMFPLALWFVATVTVVIGITLYGATHGS